MNYDDEEEETLEILTGDDKLCVLDAPAVSVD